MLERRAGGDTTEGSYFTIAPNGLDGLDLLDVFPSPGRPTPERHDTIYGAAAGCWAS